MYGSQSCEQSRKEAENSGVNCDLQTFEFQQEMDTKKKSAQGMAHAEKCLSHKYEKLSSESQHPQKNRVHLCTIGTPVTPPPEKGREKRRHS